VKTNSSSIATSLAELKAAKSPSPLSLFLHIYSKAQRECYLNYDEGTNCLYNYLTNNGTIPLSLPTDKYPEILNPNFKVPSLLRGYENGQVAKIIVGGYEDKPINTYLRKHTITENAIYFVMSREIIKELY